MVGRPRTSVSGAETVNAGDSPPQSCAYRVAASVLSHLPLFDLWGKREATSARHQIMMILRPELQSWFEEMLQLTEVRTYGYRSARLLREEVGERGYSAAVNVITTGGSIVSQVRTDMTSVAAALGVKYVWIFDVAGT